MAILLEIGWGDAGLSAVTIVYPIVAFIQACKRTRQRSKQVNRHSKLADARIQRALNDPCSVLQRPYAKTFGRKWEYVTSGAGVHYHHFIRNGFADFRHRSRPIHP